MVKYKKIFLSEIKSLLSYFIKFSNNKFMLSKIYLTNCIIRRSNQRFIIMIIYNKNIFSIYDSY